MTVGALFWNKRLAEMSETGGFAPWETGAAVERCVAED